MSVWAKIKPNLVPHPIFLKELYMDILSQMSLFAHSELQNKKDHCKTFSGQFEIFRAAKKWPNKPIQTI